MSLRETTMKPRVTTPVTTPVTKDVKLALDRLLTNWPEDMAPAPTVSTAGRRHILTIGEVFWDPISTRSEVLGRLVQILLSRGMRGPDIWDLIHFDPGKDPKGAWKTDPYWTGGVLAALLTQAEKAGKL